MIDYRKTSGLTLEEIAERQRESGMETAIREGDLFKERVLSGDDMLTENKAAMTLGCTAESLDKMARARQVLRLEGGNSGHRYPSFQFEDNVRPIIGDVLAAMPGYDPWGVYLFLVQPEPLLYPGTPLEWIKRGKNEDVLRVAALLNEDQS